MPPAWLQAGPTARPACLLAKVHALAGSLRRLMAGPCMQTGLRSRQQARLMAAAGIEVQAERCAWLIFEQPKPESCDRLKH